MNRAGRVAISIVTGFVIAVVIASACVVAYSQYTRAHDAEAELTQVRDDLQQSAVDLSLVQSDLDDAESELESTQGTLSTTQTALHRTSRQRDVSDRRMSACRYLVPINDHLLYAMNSQSAATQHLLSRTRLDAHRRTAARHIRRAGHHAKAVIRLVRRAGYKDLTHLVEACAPPRK